MGEVGFDKGNIVTCVDAGGSGKLTTGRVYTVSHSDDSYTYVEGVFKTSTTTLAGWCHSRFKQYIEGPAKSRKNDPATSKGKRKVNKYEQAVLSVLSLTSAYGGSTGKAIASASGHPLNCITPRFAPLRRKGLIKDSGVKRDKQTVWVMA